MATTEKSMRDLINIVDERKSPQLDGLKRTDLTPKQKATVERMQKLIDQEYEHGMRRPGA